MGESASFTDSTPWNWRFCGTVNWKQKFPSLPARKAQSVPSSSTCLEDAARSLLSICRQISQKQLIEDLCIFHHQCEEVTIPDVFNLSQNAVSVKLEDVKYPDDVIAHLVSKINTCTTLSLFDLNHTILQSVTSLNLHDMTSLIRLDLSYTNMSKQLIDNVCGQLKHLVEIQKFNISFNILSAKNGCQIAEAVTQWRPSRDCTVRLRVTGRNLWTHSNSFVQSTKTTALQTRKKHFDPKFKELDFRWPSWIATYGVDSCHGLSTECSRFAACWEFDQIQKSAKSRESFFGRKSIEQNGRGIGNFYSGLSELPPEGAEVVSQ